MPFAYVQHDSVRLLVAGSDWLLEDRYEAMTNNVPFLVPALYRVALHGPWPGLISIELVQHFLGLVQVVLAGLISRFWFIRWKWWIIPVTMLFAVHPSFLWYEHTVMLETFYLLFVMMLTLAGIWFLRHPSLAALGVVGFATWLVAASRPEGKLFLVFPILAAGVAFFGRWPQLAKSAVIVALTAVAIAQVSVAGECGLLLYSSVLHLSPEVSARFPDAAPYVADLRKEAVDHSAYAPAFVSRPQRVALAAALKQYVREYPAAGQGNTEEKRMNSVAQALAYETCLQHLWPLFPLSLQKFRACSDELASGRMSTIWLHDRQISRLRGSWISLRQIETELYGRRFARLEDVDPFIRSVFHAPRLTWFETWSDLWETIYERHFRDTRYVGERLPGLPFFYLLPLAGILLGVLCQGPARRFHVCWVPTLGLVWFIVMVTANERARFRFVFEPFFFLYAFSLFAFVANWLVTRRIRWVEQPVERVPEEVSRS